MKKFSLIFLSLTLTAAITACGEPLQTDVTDSSINDSSDAPVVSVDSDGEASVNDTSAPETISTYEIKLDNGVTVVIGGDAEALIASLGEPVDYMEAPSCIHEGFDKVYTYDGYSINTSPDANGKQYVAELALLSDAVALENGLMIGGTASDVEAAFGTDCEDQFGVRIYKLDGVTVSITIDADSVTAITLSSTR